MTNAMEFFKSAMRLAFSFFSVLSVMYTDDSDDTSYLRASGSKWGICKKKLETGST